MARQARHRRLGSLIRQRPWLVPLMIAAVALPLTTIMIIWWGGDDRGGQADRGPGTASEQPGDIGTADQRPPSTSASPTTSATATPGPSTPGARPGGVWRPAPATRWQWQIVDKVTTPFQNVAMYDVDLTDAVPAATTVTVTGFGQVTWPKGANAGIVERLHAAGKVVICYLDTGAYESYEPDAKLFPGKPGWSAGDPASDVIGATSGWDNEYWLDIRPTQRAKFAPIMWARFDLARTIGCDGVEPDQNNPVGNNPGPPITLADEKSWYLEVARAAHARGLSVGMKNGIEVTDADTVAAFDWNLNEQCFFFEECDVLAGFIKAGKAVFQVEYTEDWADKGFTTPAALASSNQVCAAARPRQFATLIKRQVPDASYVAC